MEPGINSGQGRVREQQAQALRLVLRASVAIAATSSAIAFVVMLLAFAANLAVLSQGPDRVRQTLNHAIDDGSFFDTSAISPWGIFFVRKGDEVPSSYQYQTYHYDCMIWRMVLAEPPGGLLTKVLRNPRPQTALLPRDPRFLPECQTLSPLLASDGAMNASTGQDYYDRYILGQRAIAQVMLDHFSVQTAGAITRGLVAGAFTLAFILAWRKRAATVACIAALFLLFQPLSLFGSVLNFAPLDFLHALILISALYLPFGTVRPAYLVLIGALYGSFIAVFEILTGGIPMALALMALLTGASARDQRGLVERVAILAGAFTTAVIACFAIKVIAIALMFGAGIFADFWDALLHRINGDLPAEMSPKVIEYLAAHGIDAVRHPIYYMLATYAYWSLLIGWGSPIFGCALVICGLGALIASTVSFYRRRSAYPPALVSCWMGMAVIVGWVLLFQNHTVLHAFMMARLLLIPVLCGSVATLVRLQLHDPRGFGAGRGGSGGGLGLTYNAMTANERPMETSDC